MDIEYFPVLYALSLFTPANFSCILSSGINAMGDFGAATQMAYSPSSRPMPDGDLIAHLVPEAWETVVRLRFVPLSYLKTACDIQLDRGVERLLYLQSFIDEDEEF